MEKSADIAVPKSMPDSIPGKIDRAKGYKDEGNEYFKNGKFKKAIVYYSRALAFTKGLPGRTGGMDEMSRMASNASNQSAPQISQEDNALVEELEVVLKNNIATCYIKLEDPENAMKAANEALALRPKHWKSVLRKGEAKTLYGDYESAISLLTEALSLAPDEASSKAILKSRDNATKLDKNATKKQKTAFKGLFEKDREQQALAEDNGAEGEGEKA